MKKISLFSTLLVLLIIGVLLCGCGSNKTAPNEGTVKEEESKSIESVQNGGKAGEAKVDSVEVGDFKADDIANGIEVETYTYKKYGNYYLILVLKNTVQDCALNVSLDFVDAKGNIVGTEEETVDAFAKDTEVALEFSSDEKFSKYKWEFEPEELDYYSAVTQNLVCDVTLGKEKAIVSVTNNGSVSAQFVSFRALYFNNNKLVNTDFGYIGDSDSEIKAGKTKKEESKCYEKFDSVKVYLDGRSEEEW